MTVQQNVEMSDSICDGKPKINSHQSSNSAQLENQLKEVLNEPSSLRLIMDFYMKKSSSRNKHLLIPMLIIHG